MIRYRFCLIILLILSVTACGSDVEKRKLDEINALTNKAPKDAVDTLKTISRGELTEANRYYYDLQCVKAADKDFRVHTSDSVIRKVLSYVKTHNDVPWGTEAIYYGGRVYGDLGDLPTALGYYYTALRGLDAGQIVDNNLYVRTLGQTSKALMGISMYKAAIPLLRKSVNINKQIKDTIGECYDLQLLGECLSRTGQSDSAAVVLQRAAKFDKYLVPEDRAITHTYMAKALNRINRCDEAKRFVNLAISEVDSMDRHVVLAVAAEIYRKSGPLDSAILLARQLIDYPEAATKQTGYQILLDSICRTDLPMDSILRMTKDYVACVNSYYNDNEVDYMISQQSCYNYLFHEDRRKEAERHADMTYRYLLIAVSAIALLGCITLWLLYKNKAKTIRLYEALNSLDQLRSSLETATVVEDADFDQQSITKDTQSVSASKSVNDLRQRLTEELTGLYTEFKSDSLLLDDRIESSEAYRDLLKRIAEQKPLQLSDELWCRLEREIVSVSPQFKSRLRILTGGRLSTTDLQTSILIKCHVSPTHMGCLLGRSKTAISSRRARLAAKIFGAKTDGATLDGVIRLL